MSYKQIYNAIVNIGNMNKSTDNYYNTVRDRLSQLYRLICDDEDIDKNIANNQGYVYFDDVYETLDSLVKLIDDLEERNYLFDINPKIAIKEDIPDLINDTLKNVEKQSELLGEYKQIVKKKDKTIDDINEKLDDLKTFTDGNIYRIKFRGNKKFVKVGKANYKDDNNTTSRTNYNSQSQFYKRMNDYQNKIVKSGLPCLLSADFVSSYTFRYYNQKKGKKFYIPIFDFNELGNIINLYNIQETETGNKAIRDGETLMHRILHYNMEKIGIANRDEKYRKLLELVCAGNTDILTKMNENKKKGNKNTLNEWYILKGSYAFEQINNKKIRINNDNLIYNNYNFIYRENGESGKTTSTKIYYTIYENTDVNQEIIKCTIGKGNKYYLKYSLEVAANKHGLTDAYNNLYNENQFNEIYKIARKYVSIAYPPNLSYDIGKMFNNKKFDDIFYEIQSNTIRDIHNNEFKLTDNIYTFDNIEINKVDIQHYIDLINSMYHMKFDKVISINKIKINNNEYYLKENTYTINRLNGKIYKNQEIVNKTKGKKCKLELHDGSNRTFNNDDISIFIYTEGINNDYSNVYIEDEEIDDDYIEGIVLHNPK